MSKRLMILILVVLSVVVTWYIEYNKPEVNAAVRAKVEADMAKDPTFPARPVWWEKGYRLGVGVIPNGKNRDADARRVCDLLNKYGVHGSKVEVYDVLQIQKDDHWEQIGGAHCS